MVLVVLGIVAGAAPLHGQEDSIPERPFVSGGVYDKPYLGRLAGRAAIGGYAEGHFRAQRVDGVTEELGFVAKRFNLFAAAQVSDFVRFSAELEFEDAAEEISLEFAAIDLILHPALAIRGGMLLVPLGRFNLSHDSPLNEFTDRPLVSTEIIGVALSQPGAGALGTFGLGSTARATYELYAINGYDDGLITNSPDGTRIPAGKKNFENNNNKLAGVGRVTYSPRIGYEIGLSGYHGSYNMSEVDGLEVEPNQNLTIGVLDFELSPFGFRISGEAVTADIDIPASLSGSFASGQRGLFVDVLYDFGRDWIKAMPNSYLSIAARYDYVDFDTDRRGDDTNQITLGLNFRPTADTAFKLDYVRGRSHDKFNNPSDSFAFLFSLATYF